LLSKDAKRSVEKKEPDMSNLGFRIFSKMDWVAPSVIERYLEAKLPTSNIADVMGRFGAIGQGIHPINEDGVYLVGTAFTVRVPPSDNLMVHKAMDLAKLGDIIVVEASGDMRSKAKSTSPRKAYGSGPS
jgi:Aldolase/RraA